MEASSTEAQLTFCSRQFCPDSHGHSPGCSFSLGSSLVAAVALHSCCAHQAGEIREVGRGEGAQSGAGCGCGDVALALPGMPPCLTYLGLSENVGYIPNYSHLIGIVMSCGSKKVGHVGHRWVCLKMLGIFPMK